jgi:hypothetical protein
MPQLGNNDWLSINILDFLIISKLFLHLFPLFWSTITREALIEAAWLMLWQQNLLAGSIPQ